MFTVRRVAGRLVEVIMASPVTEQEIQKADGAMAEVVKGAGRVVICADYTRAKVLPQELSGKLVEMFKKHNAGIERSAVLCAADSATAILQMERVIREAQNPSRKFFRDRAELCTWLAEVLDDDAKKKLGELLK
jgi:hypothetical protein